MAKRILHLTLFKKWFDLIVQGKKKEERNLILNQREYAATKVGIALISGWEEFRDYLKNREMAIEEVEKQFSEKYKGMLIGEYIFRQNAALICHGLLHCMGSPHPLTQNSYFIKTSELDEIPNIMSYRLPKFEKDCVLGYKLDYLQKKLIHSFIAGNNAYRAFLASQRDLDIFIENLKKAN